MTTKRSKLEIRRCGRGYNLVVSFIAISSIMTLLLPKNDMVPKSRERPFSYCSGNEFYLPTFPCFISLGFVNFISVKGINQLTTLTYTKATRWKTFGI